MNISEAGVEITKRFFLALEVLSQDKKIRGLKTFSRKYDINYWNLNTVKKEPYKRILKPEYIYYLVMDFGISADWLIKGEGEIYASQISKT